MLGAELVLTLDYVCDVAQKKATEEWADAKRFVWLDSHPLCRGSGEGKECQRRS